MRLRFTDVTNFVSSYHMEGGRRKEEGGRRKEEGGRRKEEGGVGANHAGEFIRCYSPFRKNGRMENAQ
jgi:hypothetical protein